jgi:hypothetical protein
MTEMCQGVYALRQQNGNPTIGTDEGGVLWRACGIHGEMNPCDNDLELSMRLSRDSSDALSNVETSGNVT